MGYGNKIHDYWYEPDNLRHIDAYGIEVTDETMSDIFLGGETPDKVLRRIYGGKNLTGPGNDPITPLEYEARAMAEAVNGGSWDKDYTDAQKTGWKAKVRWAMERYGSDKNSAE